jgi:hypothetical protein
MSNERKRGREVVKDVVNEIAESYTSAVIHDPNLDPYQKANARLGLAVGQLIANVAVDLVADYLEEE